MENTNTDSLNEPVSRPSGTKVALINGIYMGLALIIVSLVLYLLDVPRDSYIQYINYLVMIVLTFVFVKQWRDQYNDGYLSYGGAFGHGFLVILFGSILTAIYTFVFYQIIAPIEVEIIYEEAIQDMYEQGRSDAEIEMAEPWIKASTGPIGLAIISLLINTIVGLIISAILAIFIKKEPKEF